MGNSVNGAGNEEAGERIRPVKGQNGPWLSSGFTNTRNGRGLLETQPSLVGKSTPNSAIGAHSLFLSFCHLTVVRFRPPLPASMSSPPWIPSLNGKILDPCSLIADLVADDLKPSSRVDSDCRWSMTALGPLLDADPEMKAPLWAAVVAIWRLKCSEEEGRNCEIWKSHLQAWLVRRVRSWRARLLMGAEVSIPKVVSRRGHRTVRRHHGLRCRTGAERDLTYRDDPFDGNHSSRSAFPKLTLVAQQQPTVLSACVPGNTPPPDPTLFSHQSPAWTIETLSLPSTTTSSTPDPLASWDRLADHRLVEQGPTAGDEDQEMVDGGNGGAPAPQEQVKGEKFEEEDSGVSSSSDESVPTGSKRRTRSSFNRVDTTKRLRVDEALADGINLGGYVFDEDSAVDPKLVPSVQGAVCEVCAKKEVGGCKVAWHLNTQTGKVTFRCVFCKEHKRGCSFRDSRWGISALPTLLRTQKGNAHRKEDNARRRPTSARHNPGHSPLSMRSTRAKSVGSTTSLVPPSKSSREGSKISSKRTAVKTTDTAYSIPDQEGPASRREVVFFESLDPYMEVLHRADPDSSTLRVAMAGVRVAMLCEEGGLAVVRSMVSDRVVAMQSLLDRLELKMKESLRAEAELEKTRLEGWENGGREANDGVEGPSISRVGSGNGTK